METISFDSKRVQKTSTHTCMQIHCGAGWKIWKQLVNFTSTFAEVLIWDYNNCFHPVFSLAMIVSIGSCEASFHSVAVVHIYVKSIHCNVKIKRYDVCDALFSSFPLNLGFFAFKSTFVSLEAACKTIPEKLYALARQTLQGREKFIVFSQANCL